MSSNAGLVIICQEVQVTEGCLLYLEDILLSIITIRTTIPLQARPLTDMRWCHG